MMASRNTGLILSDTVYERSTPSLLATNISNKIGWIHSRHLSLHKLNSHSHLSISQQVPTSWTAGLVYRQGKLSQGHHTEHTSFKDHNLDKATSNIGK